MDDKTLFWTQLCKACERIGKKPNRVASEIGLSSSVMTSYKNGRIPSGEVLIKLSKYLGVSVNFLLSDIDTDVDFNIASKKEKNGFKVLFWLTQRFASIRFGNEITDEQIIDIAVFTNSELGFLYSSPETKFIPKRNSIPDVDSLKCLEQILGIMDRVDNENNLHNENTNKLYKLQMHLSHIVMYWLEQKGITGENILNEKEKYKSLSLEKIIYLYNIDTSTKIGPYKCGFNFSELDFIREQTGLSFLYMFTGYDYKDILIENNSRTT